MIKMINGRAVFSIHSTVNFSCGLCKTPLIVKPGFQKLQEGEFKIESDDNIDCDFTHKVYTNNIDLDANPEQHALYEKHLANWYFEVS